MVVAHDLAQDVTSTNFVIRTTTSLIREHFFEIKFNYLTYKMITEAISTEKSAPLRALE